MVKQPRTQYLKSPNSSRGVPAYDADGHFLAVVYPGYSDKHPREVAVDETGIRLRRSAAVPIRALTPEEKRRVELARQASRR